MSSSSIPNIPQSNYQLIINALTSYADRTGIDLSKNPFAEKIQLSNSPDAILELLHDREKAFKEYREGNRKLINRLAPAVEVLHAFSGVLGEAVSLVSNSASVPLPWLHTTSPGPFSTRKSHFRWY
jgi:hypothetical protein